MAVGISNLPPPHKPWTRPNPEARLQSTSRQATTTCHCDDGRVAQPWTGPTTSQRGATTEEEGTDHKYHGGEASFPITMAIYEASLLATGLPDLQQRRWSTSMAKGRWEAWAQGGWRWRRKNEDD